MLDQREHAVGILHSQCWNSTCAKIAAGVSPPRHLPCRKGAWKSLIGKSPKTAGTRHSSREASVTRWPLWSNCRAMSRNGTKWPRPPPSSHVSSTFATIAYLADVSVSSRGPVRTTQQVAWFGRFLAFVARVTLPEFLTCFRGAVGLAHLRP